LGTPCAAHERRISRLPDKDIRFLWVDDVIASPSLRLQGAATTITAALLSENGGKSFVQCPSPKALLWLTATVNGLAFSPNRTPPIGSRSAGPTREYKSTLSSNFGAQLVTRRISIAIGLGIILLSAGALTRVSVIGPLNERDYQQEKRRLQLPEFSRSSTISSESSV
jgi:hypothetical protein